MRSSSTTRSSAVSCIFELLGRDLRLLDNARPHLHCMLDLRLDGGIRRSREATDEVLLIAQA